MKYRDVSGNSGIVNFSSGNDFIWIEFKGDKVYLYNSRITGEEAIKELNKKAILGKGLSGFISQNPDVGDNYVERYHLCNGRYEQF